MLWPVFRNIKNVKLSYLSRFSWRFFFYVGVWNSLRKKPKHVSYGVDKQKRTWVNKIALILSLLKDDFYCVLQWSIVALSKGKFTKNFIFSHLGDGPCLGTWDPDIKKYTWLTYNQVSKTMHSALHVIFWIQIRKDLLFLPTIVGELLLFFFFSYCYLFKHRESFYLPLFFVI